MGGYSKIKIMGASSSSHSRNSRSIDFSDLQSFSQTQKSTPKNPTSSKIQEETNLNLQHMKKNNTTHDSSEEDCEGNGGERLGTHVMHKRNSSVSSFSSSASASATGLGLGLGFQSALKGAFSSMRRSSSVSERYCRIHDQSATTALTSSIDGNEEDDEDRQATRSTKKKHKGGGKILKVCHLQPKNDHMTRFCHSPSRDSIYRGCEMTKLSLTNVKGIKSVLFLGGPHARDKPFLPRALSLFPRRSLSLSPFKLYEPKHKTLESPRIDANKGILSL